VRKIGSGGYSQFLLSKYYLGDAIEKGQMGEICSMYPKMKIHKKISVGKR
jgi:hypothetical protein